MIVIGLMGAVGAGKSTVAEILRSMGASVHDADLAAHEALREPEACAEVTALLGPGVLGPDGNVDRAKAAQRVFGNPAALKGLESILHPLVRKRMEAWLEAERGRGAPAAVLDVPLLAEAGMDDRCDVLAFIDAPEAVRAERLRSGRGWAPEEAARRQALQGGLEGKRARAHAVIPNSGALDETRRHVTAFWKAHVLDVHAKGGTR